MWILLEEMRPLRNLGEAVKALRSRVSFPPIPTEANVDSCSLVQRAIVEPKPAFDPKTQRLIENIQTTVLADDGVKKTYEFRAGWVVVPIPQGELDQALARKRKEARAQVDKLLHGKLMELLLADIRQKNPTVVSKAQAKIDAINASSEPEGVDISNIWG